MRYKALKNKDGSLLLLKLYVYKFAVSSCILNKILYLCTR